MKQRYNDLSHDLCVQAVLEAFEDKWLRRDVVQLANKYGGVSYERIKRDSVSALILAITKTQPPAEHGSGWMWTD